MVVRTRVRFWVPGFILGLTPLLAPVQAQAQSARFEQFGETTPMAGEMAPDFTLFTLDNEPFNLLDEVMDMPLVIEFGSFT